MHKSNLNQGRRNMVKDLQNPDIKVLVRKTDKVKRMVYKWLTLGSNVRARLDCPAWTSGHLGK